MKVELLYIDGCPNLQPLERNLRRVVEPYGTAARIELRQVRTRDEAIALRFLGSPTVRVDGEDVEVGADGRRDWGLKCRLYRSGEDLVGYPEEPMLVAAVGRAQNKV